MCAWWKTIFPGLLVIVAAAFLPVRSVGAATIVYSTSFEPAEGYHQGPGLAGQDGWIASGTGGDGIITNGLLGHFQTAYIGFNPPATNEAGHAVAHRLGFNPLQRQLPLVTFSVAMAVFPSTSTNQDWFDWAVFAANKELFALSFSSGRGNQPISYQVGDGTFVDTGQTYTNEIAYTLTVTMDFTANQWSAMLDSTLLVTNQLMSAATGTNDMTLDVVMAEWVFRNPTRPGNDYMVFDDYRITAQPAASALTGPTLQLASGSPGQVSLHLLGQPGATYALEASEDLRSWTEIAALPSPDGNWDYTDTTAGSLGQRFYRARSTASAP
jgi:hypothetical protein